MTLKILEVEANLLPQYATIPIAFRVESIFQVELVGQGLGGIQLREAKVSPYIKDYDALPDGGPLEWPRQFDIRNWGILMAEEAGKYVGGAAVAFNTNGVNMLERRSDLAVLWDIRVRPERRGRGIGKALFHASADWARPRGCRQLKVETQNVNVAACRFYASQGCELGALHRYGYAAHPQVGHEAMLLWYLTL
jgi:GNAT superfamily N-acetyltransferase